MLYKKVAVNNDFTLEIRKFRTIYSYFSDFSIKFTEARRGLLEKHKGSYTMVVGVVLGSTIAWTT